MQGVITNLPFLRALVRAPAVRSAALDTEWIEREFLKDFAALISAPAPESALAAAAIAELLGLGGSGPGRANAASPGASGAGDAFAEPFATLGRWRLPGLG